jgi:hypothetical protein
MRVLREGSTMILGGLSTGQQIRLALRSNDREEHGRSLLEYIGVYVDSGAAIHAGETMAYGSWILRFEGLKDETLTITESVADWSGKYETGASRAIRLWNEQRSVCTAAGSPHLPPAPHLMVATSVGVLEGEAVDGVRYPAPAHMTGWYVTTDRYDGDARSLRVDHLYHLLAARPDLARFLALGPGFFFDSRDGYVGYSQKAANG